VVAADKRLTLEEELVDFLQHRFKPDDDKIDREALIELGSGYLTSAKKPETDEEK